MPLKANAADQTGRSIGLSNNGQTQGHLLPINLAAELAGTTLDKVEALIAAGTIVCDRIKGRRYVDLAVLEVALREGR